MAEELADSAFVRIYKNLAFTQSTIYHFCLFRDDDANLHRFTNLHWPMPQSAFQWLSAVWALLMYEQGKIEQACKHDWKHDWKQACKHDWKHAWSSS